MRRTLTATLVLLFLLAAGCQRGEPNAPGGTAPDFRADDLTGRTHYLSAELQQPVVLTFFATWCAPCLSEIPYFLELNQRFAGRARILGLAVDPENIDKLQTLASNMKIDYPVLLDQDRRIMDLYGVKVLPMTLLLSNDGRIRSRFDAIDRQQAEILAGEIERLLEEKE